MRQNDTFAVHERPGRGIYRCVERPHWVVSLDCDIEPLPPCFDEARFQDVQYRRVVDLSTAIVPPAAEYI
jgi:hypothetical protein